MRVLDGPVVTLRSSFPGWTDLAQAWVRSFVRSAALAAVALRLAEGEVEEVVFAMYWLQDAGILESDCQSSSAVLLGRQFLLDVSVTFCSPIGGLHRS